MNQLRMMLDAHRLTFAFQVYYFLQRQEWYDEEPFFRMLYLAQRSKYLSDSSKNFANTSSIQ